LWYWQCTQLYPGLEVNNSVPLLKCLTTRKPIKDKCWYQNKGRQ
jgi:hypothetical protein